MKVVKAKGRLLRRLAGAADGDHALALFRGRKVVGFVTFYVATPSDPDFYVAGVAVRRDARQAGTLPLLRALKKVVQRNRAAVGKGFRMSCDTESTAGERLVRIAEKHLRLMILDFGKLERALKGSNVRETGAWQELV